MTLQLTDTLGKVTWSAEQQVQFASYFSNLLAGRSGSSAALVLSAAGSERDADGTSAGLSNSIDRSFLVALRNRSSMVITTGATVRAEGLHFPKHGRLALLTREREISVPRISGAGEITPAHWGQHDERAPLLVTCGDRQLLISGDAIELELLLQRERVHFETGMSTMTKLWNLGLVHNLWLSHTENFDVVRVFRNAKTQKCMQLGELTLSLLNPEGRTASL